MGSSAFAHGASDNMTMSLRCVRHLLKEPLGTVSAPFVGNHRTARQPNMTNLHLTDSCWRQGILETRDSLGRGIGLCFRVHPVQGLQEESKRV